jgi:hypothetical protein
MQQVMNTKTKGKNHVFNVDSGLWNVQVMGPTGCGSLLEFKQL